MTTAAVSARTLGRDSATGRRGPTLARAVASEWTKLVSLRSTAWIAVVSVVVTWVVTYLSANASSTDPGFDPASSLPDSVGLSQLGTLVLGVLAGTGEFRSGAFRTTFTAIPRRVTVLLARTVVVAAVGAVVAGFAVAAAVLGVLPAARSRDIPLDLASGWTPQVLVGCGLLLCGMALLGLGIGSLLRRTVPAVTVGLALVFVIPVALTMATGFSGPTSPAPAATSLETDRPQIDPVSTVLAFLPGEAAFRMTTTPDFYRVDGAPNLGPRAGGLVFATWILVSLAAAGARLGARDVT